MPNYWFTADTHFSHKNIMKYCERPFRSVDEMDNTIIANWNNVIKSNDFVYHLGDFAFRNHFDIFNQLKGKKFLICGNHDDQRTFNCDWLWIKNTAMININGQYIWLSHYAHRSWNRSFHGSWHLFGHTHNVLKPYYTSFDVGVDGHNFKLWSYDDVDEVMKELKYRFKNCAI